MKTSNKENLAIFILCAAAGLMWAQSAGLFKPSPSSPRARPPAGGFHIAPAEDQSHRDPVPSGFERPQEPPHSSRVRDSLSVRELQILDADSNVVMRVGVSSSGSGIWMGRPGKAAEFEAGVQANGLPFFQLYADGRPGVVWAGVDENSMPNLVLRESDRLQFGLGLSPSRQGEVPYLFHTDAEGKKRQFLNPSMAEK